MTGITVLVLLSLIVQRALGWPGMPLWADLVVLPMVWIVAPALLRHDRAWVYLAFALGLAWDLVLNLEVVGPGGVSWSAAALGLNLLGGFVADRSPKAWFAFGAAGTAVLIAAHTVALLPLGLRVPMSWQHVLLSVVLTGTWCGFVGWMLALQPLARWHTYRARRLR